MSRQFRGCQFPISTGGLCGAHVDDREIFCPEHLDVIADARSGRATRRGAGKILADGIDDHVAGERKRLLMASWLLAFAAARGQVR